jgi:hypothetical protein
VCIVKWKDDMCVVDGFGKFNGRKYIFVTRRTMARLTSSVTVSTNYYIGADWILFSNNLSTITFQHRSISPPSSKNPQKPYEITSLFSPTNQHLPFLLS